MRSPRKVPDWNKEHLQPQPEPYLKRRWARVWTDIRKVQSWQAEAAHGQIPGHIPLRRSWPPSRRLIKSTVQWIWLEKELLQAVQSRSQIEIASRNLSEHLSDWDFRMLSLDIRPHLDGRTVLFKGAVREIHGGSAIRREDLCSALTNVPGIIRIVYKPANSNCQRHLRNTVETPSKLLEK